MKKVTQIILVMLFSSLISYSCANNPAPVEEDTEATLQKMFSEAQTETAVFDLTISKELTAQAPPPSATFTNTPESTETPAATETPAVQPTSDNPWMLQPECETSTGCEKLEIQNKSSIWVNVFLEDTKTGVQKYFSVAPKTRAFITLLPSYYRYILTYCGNKVSSGYHGLNGHWYVQFDDRDCK